MEFPHKLDPSLQRKLDQHMVNSMIHENMGMLLSLSEDCFTQCVHKFPSKILDKDESACIEHCADRYLKFRLRIGQKFQYYQALKKQEYEKEKQEKQQQQQQ